MTVGPDLTYNGGRRRLRGQGQRRRARRWSTAATSAAAATTSGTGIAVDGAGNAYVTGDTDSTEATFPVDRRAGPDLQRRRRRLRGQGQRRRHGAGLLRLHRRRRRRLGYGIAVDSSGNAYVTGYTASTEATFPVTVGPDLTYNGGSTTPSWPRSCYFDAAREPKHAVGDFDGDGSDEVAHGFRRGRQPGCGTAGDLDAAAPLATRRAWSAADVDGDNAGRGPRSTSAAAGLWLWDSRRAGPRLSGVNVDGLAAGDVDATGVTMWSAILARWDCGFWKAARGPSSAGSMLTTWPRESGWDGRR